ncbi:MAG: hypothetical protein GF311_00865 [Candidatus Lokiarchaeota archaeon]|nr:hypothetical protein [Candidatus Lokiarchaeota archaeon]
MSIQKPVEIYQEYRDGALKEKTALNLLRSYVEHSNNPDIRSKSLEIIQKIDVKNLNLFFLLENILISDSDKKLRRISAEMIVKTYLKKGLTALKWAIRMESSPDFFYSVFTLLKERNPSLTRSIIDKEFEEILKRKVISPIQYYIGKLNTLFSRTDYAEFSLNELIYILHNFKFIDDLLRKNEIAFYEVKEGVISKLSLYPVNREKLSDINGLKELIGLEGLGISGEIELDCLNKFKDLKTLIVENSPHMELEIIKNFTKLEILVISGCKLKEITHLENLKNLKRVDFEYNNLKKIQGLEHLTKLEILILKCNHISEIEGLDNLYNLKELHLQYNLISKIKGLTHLKNLEVLNLEWNNISKIKGLNKLNNLYYLNLKFNAIHEISGLQKLKNLEYLNLKNN